MTTKTFMDRAVAGEWATPDALLDALAWPMTFPGDAPKAEAAGMTQEEFDLLHAAACTGLDSYRSRSGRMLAHIVEHRREEARLKAEVENGGATRKCLIEDLAAREAENDTLRALVQEVEWNGPGLVECPWCGAREHESHRADCTAAKAMGWRMGS